MANGSYSLTAVATDNNNEATTSGAVSITVQSNTPPTVSMTAPTNGAVYAAPAGSITLTATAAGQNGATISSVKFYQGEHAARHGHHVAVHLQLDQRARQQLHADRGRHRQP